MVAAVIHDSNSLVEMVFTVAEQKGNKEALFHKIGGQYQGITYANLRQRCINTAMYLKSLGVGEHDYVGLMCNNRPEWVYVDLGAQVLGAASVPIYPTLSPEDCQYIINKTKMKVLVFETPKQIVPLAKTLEDCPHLEQIICIEEPSKAQEFCPQLKVQAFTSKIEHARIEFEDKEDSFLASCPRLTHDHVASIVFTSGTTGTPKGVMLTHGNFLSNIAGAHDAIELTSDEVVLSFLPLSHVFERTTGYYVILGLGATIYYAENMDSVGDNLQECRPTALVSVPRLYEKIQARILDNLSGIRKPIFHWAIDVGKKVAKAKKNGRIHNPMLLLQHRLATLLVYKKVKARTGGKLRFFVSGGAPLSKEIGEFFEAVGLLIIEGYGMTESSPVICCNRLEEYKFGTVGKAFFNVQVKIAEDGELLAKGPSIMKGYLDEPEKTSAVLDEQGWLHTGDIAQIDEEGFIKIVDRKKDLIVLSNGKNVAPQRIEMMLAESRYISQVVLLGEKRNFVSALIIPSWEYLRSNPPFTDCATRPAEELCEDQRLIQFFERLVDDKNQQIARYEQVKKFTLLSREFTQEDGELTPSLKPKRPVIRDKYKDKIDALYAS